MAIFIYVKRSLLSLDFKFCVCWQRQIAICLQYETTNVRMKQSSTKRQRGIVCADSLPVHKPCSGHYNNTKHHRFPSRLSACVLPTPAAHNRHKQKGRTCERLALPFASACLLSLFVGVNGSDQRITHNNGLTLHKYDPQ